MTSTFKLIQINSQAELDRYGVREFAAEFGHRPIGLPIILWFYDDELVAYVEVRMTPVLYPAVHPNVSPRAFLEGGRMLCDKVRRDYQGALVIYDHRSAYFQAEAMERLGFELSPLKFFEPKETHNGSQGTEHT
jgi:hypothetical protein